MALLSGSKRKQGTHSIVPDTRRQLDAYARGDYDYESLASNIRSLCKVNDDSVWEVLSVLDQYHRRGVLPDEVFRSLKAIVSFIALGPPMNSTGGLRKPGAATRNKQPEHASAHSAHEEAHIIDEHPTHEPAELRKENTPHAAPVAPAPEVAHHEHATIDVATEPKTELGVNQNDERKHAEITAEQFLTRMGGANYFDLPHDEASDEPPTLMRHARSLDDVKHTAPSSKHGLSWTFVDEQPTADATEATDRPDMTVRSQPASYEQTKLRAEVAAESSARKPDDDLPGTERGRNARQASMAKSVTPGRVLHDRYEIESALAFGRSSAVFRVHDRYRTEDNRPLAVKVLLLNVTPDSPRQFEHELRIAQQLSHPNIVKVFDLDRDGDLLFYSMELIEGQSLNDLLQYSPPKRPQAMAILTQVANALIYLHDRNVVHGDIHPDNILISATGQVKLLDFGSAADHQSSKPWLNVIADKPSSSLIYASCERLQGMEADRRDDIFSLSCIAYELLGREHPFRGRLSTRARDANQLPPRLPELSSRQWRSLQHGLAWRRDERPESVREWLAGLESSAAAPSEGYVSSELRATARAEQLEDQSMIAAPIKAEPRRRGVPVAPAATASRETRHVSSTWYWVVVVGVIAVLAFAFMRFDFDAATSPTLAQTQSTVKRALNEGVASLTGENPASTSSNASTVSASNTSQPSGPSNANDSQRVDLDQAPGNVLAPPPPTASGTAAATNESFAAVAQTSAPAVANAASSEASSVSSSVASAMSSSVSSYMPATTPAPVKADQTTKAIASAKTDNKDKATESHGRITFAQDTFSANKQDGAARIKLKREGGAAGKVTFTWWAEPGTAEVGKDFMSLGKKTETLDNGEREITVFVPLISGSNNDNRHVFFVELSDPSNGLAIGRITRAKVVIEDE